MSVIGKIIGRKNISSGGSLERQIVIGLITSSEFIRDIQQIYINDSFKIPFAKTITQWCFEYFDKYQKAPGKHIERIFYEKEAFLDADESDMIKEFFEGISEQYVNSDKFDEPYILDKAEEYFRNRSLKCLMSDIQHHLVNDNIDDAESLIKNYTNITKTKIKGVDPIFDLNIINDALDLDTSDRLFSFPGVLGQTMGYLERGWLFSFVGSSGTGKTWWLMYAALKALFSGLNVLFVSLEMSEKQMVKRIQHYITGLPSKKYEGVVDIPYFECENIQSCNHFKKKKAKCDICKSYTPVILYKKSSKKEMTFEQAAKKSNAIKKSALLRGNKFKLVTFPSKSVNMEGLRSYLNNLEKMEGFSPDVIVTDYADKFAPANNRTDNRHQIASIWEEHKALALEKNCLVITASQSNTARTGKKIKQGDWAESIAKLELLDAGMAINMSPDDKKKGCMKAVMLKQRHDDFSLNTEITVLHNYRIGRPYLGSAIMKKN